MAPIDDAPPLIARMSVAIECPTCRAVPTQNLVFLNFGPHPTDERRGLPTPNPLQLPLGCTTCGKVHPRASWLRQLPDPDLSIE